MSEAAQVLLVEDDLAFAHALKIILESEGYKVEHVCTTSAASESLRQQRFDVVLLDYSLPDRDGLHALEMLASYDPELPILFLTGHNDAALAVRALRAGAADYLTKPVARVDLLLALDNARKRVLQRQQRVLYRAKGNDLSGNHISLPVGSSETWLRTLELICAAARSPRTTVLLTGEPGVGKEVAASLLHRLSPRSTQPFVAANAACLSPNLIESELFGHEAGSFTGAHSRRRGLFELASGGTLFLDEIGELPLDLQGKLLRVLEGHPFRRVGGEKELSSDARLICATNRNLAQRVQDGLFRPDLYYRLRVFEVALPPLRERRADIPELVAYFVTKLGAELGYRSPHVSPAAMKILSAHCWPGNVRELRNVIERALVVSAGAEVLPRHLPLDSAVTAAPTPVLLAGAPAGEPTAGDVSLETLIKRHVTSVYQTTGQNVTRAAALLGISRLALRKRLYAYGLRTSDS